MSSARFVTFPCRLNVLCCHNCSTGMIVLSRVAPPQHFRAGSCPFYSVVVMYLCYCLFSTWMNWIMYGSNTTILLLLFLLLYQVDEYESHSFNESSHPDTTCLSESFLQMPAYDDIVLCIFQSSRHVYTLRLALSTQNISWKMSAMYQFMNTKQSYHSSVPIHINVNTGQYNCICFVSITDNRTVNCFCRHFPIQS